MKPKNRELGGWLKIPKTYEFFFNLNKNIMSLIGSTGTGTNVITLNYLPQYLIVNSTSHTTGSGFTDFTQLNVSVNGTEIVSLSTNAILDRAFHCFNQVGGASVTTVVLPQQCLLHISDGKLENVNCNLTFTSTTDYNVYANSETLGTENYFWSTSSVNALSNNVFSDFRALIIPQLAGEVVISYTNGFSDKFTMDAGKEMVSLSSSYMSQVNIMSDSIVLFNLDGSISSAQYYNTHATNAQSITVNR